jgi:hypothetical protein
MGLAVSGALVGWAYKAGLVEKLPSLPMIGRTGTLAILAHVYSRHGGGEIARRVATVAAVIAGYQLGREGTISGDDDGYAYTAGDDDDDDAAE